MYSMLSDQQRAVSLDELHINIKRRMTSSNDVNYHKLLILFI
jgi:hypothetical protein